jgi:hypothetical protein
MAKLTTAEGVSAAIEPKLPVFWANPWYLFIPVN